MRKISRHILFLSIPLFMLGCSGNLSQIIIFEDEFEHLPAGVLSSTSGPRSEVYFMPEAGQKGEWTVSAYGKAAGYESAWEIVNEEGKNLLRQNYSNLREDKSLQNSHFHSAIVAGDSAWTNYTVRFSFKPYQLIDRCGIMFRYQNSRSYYFFGMEGNMLMIKLVQHATAPYRPFEKILASQGFNWERGKEYEGVVTLRDERIYAELNDSINLVATDHTFSHGKIGLQSDIKADFKSVEVSTLNGERRKLNRHKSQSARKMAIRLNENPAAVLSLEIPTEGFGAASNVRFGDLNNDGEADILIAQVKEKDGVTKLACLTALTGKGEFLWQQGEMQDGDQTKLIDFPFQVHDIDGDGAKEIIYLSGDHIYTLDGRTGKLRRKVRMPYTHQKILDAPHDLSRHIFFCDLEAKERDSNLIIIDGKNMVFAFDDRFRLLWSQQIMNASFPAAEDVDKDGKDEIATAYALLDDNGDLIWNVENLYGSKVNEVAMLALNPETDSAISMVYAAADWGCIVLDQSGERISHHPVGHARNLSIGNFRNDLEGYEIITSNFWGNQGLIHFYNSEGSIYNSFEPGSFSSKCLPINWMGNGEDYFVLNASAGDGGIYNGRGQLVVVLPDDGHPELCHSVMDISGDLRDEILVWDQHGIWIYTQNDNPRKGDVIHSKRSPLYNSSLYQSMVSIPDGD